jgi:membrane protein
MAKKVSRLQRILAEARALLEGRPLHAEGEISKWHRFLHFWGMVWGSFARNHCPVRASALAYGTLLALIPMLAVVMSITSTFLKKEGEDRIDQFIAKLVASVTPPAGPTGSAAQAPTSPTPETATANVTPNPVVAPANLAGEPAIQVPTNPGTNPPAVAATGEQERGGSRLTATTPGTPPQAAAAPDEQTFATRKAVARNINQFIQNTRSSALGITGSVLLIFAAISLLSQIEVTFNDIWGVARGRSWFMRIVLYWGVLSLAPILLIVVLGLATGPHLDATRRFLTSLPFIGNFLLRFGFQFLPLVVLCLSFAAFYMLMPNTRVDWRAALVGGLVSGALFHLNNAVSVLYVSRVVSNSKIYGSLGLVPVFMIGLYFSWLILLFGAQVAYAFQNRSSYLEEKQVESINQRGREFIALRLMTLVGQRFVQGQEPCTVTEMADALTVPSRLIRQIMQTLTAARLAIESAGAESAYLPARPPEAITCHDILLALRASQGQELATRDEPTRAEVYGEFQRIQEAERRVASSVTLLALVNRAQAKQLPEGASHAEPLPIYD